MKLSLSDSPQGNAMKRINTRPIFIVIVAAIVWLVAYNVIDPLAQFVTYDLARLLDGANEVSCSGFGRAMIERM